MIGTTIGSYRVLDKLGEGGMGVVYRARDTRLERTVAITVLPDLFASDPDRLARFDREVKTLASLNHPNIAQIYGTEQAPSSGPGQPASGRSPWSSSTAKTWPHASPGGRCRSTRP